MHDSIQQIMVDGDGMDEAIWQDRALLDFVPTTYGDQRIGKSWEESRLGRWSFSDGVEGAKLIYLERLVHLSPAQQ
jgi:hypothetical protein